MPETMSVEQFEVWAGNFPQYIADEDHSRLLKDMRQPIFAGISDNFTRGAAPDGTTWPPRKRIGDGHPLLIKSGTMYQASTSTFGEGHVEQITDTDLMVGADLEYAARHQFGLGRMPKREFMAIGEDTVDQLVEMTADYFVDLIINQVGG
jgi:phage gpG-like protein